MKKNKRGFTLIELLAVIVILAVIALIVSPIVSNVISKAKAGANASSVEGHIKNVEYSIARKNMDTAGYSGVKTAEQLNIDFQSNDPIRCDSYTLKDGYVISASNCNAKDADNNDKWTNNYYYYKGKGASTDSSIVEVASGRLPNGLAIGSPVYFNPNTNEICTDSYVPNEGSEEAEAGCNKWYVYKNNGDGTYQLILDKNTISSVKWNSTNSNSAPTNVMEQLATDISTWNDDVKKTARLITADEIAELTGHTFNSSSSTTGFNLDDDTTDGKNDFSWLFDYTSECTDNGCQHEGVLYFGYWTSSKNIANNKDVWVIRESAALTSSVAANDSFGIRPVITL